MGVKQISRIEGINTICTHTFSLAFMRLLAKNPPGVVLTCICSFCCFVLLSIFHLIFQLITLLAEQGLG